MEQRGLSERGMGQWEERQKDSAKGQGRNGVTENQSKECRVKRKNEAKEGQGG